MKHCTLFNRQRSIILPAVLLLVLFGVQSAAAQTNSDGDIARNRATVQRIGVGEKARVDVVLRDNTKLKGYIGTANENSFTVVDSKTGVSQTVAFADVKEVKKPRNGLKPKTWAIIAGVAAAVVIVSVVVLYPVLCDGGAGC